VIIQESSDSASAHDHGVTSDQSNHIIILASPDQPTTANAFLDGSPDGQQVDSNPDEDPSSARLRIPRIPPSSYDQQRYVRRGVQASLVLEFFFFALSLAATIPEAYNFSQSMGHSATFSGWLISIPYAMQVPSAMAAMPLVKPVWRHGISRFLIIFISVLVCIFSLVYAIAALCVSQESTGDSITMAVL
jgi:hypothetical protein